MNESFHIIKLLNNTNDFEKQDVLGFSSFAIAQVIKSKTTQENYVAKSLNYLATNSEQQKIFLKTVYKLNILRHPTLIPHDIFSFIDLDQMPHPTFIYPLLNRKNLNEICSELNNTQKMISLIGISEGLKYLHSNNVPHAALEPSNILFDNKMRPILISFGLQNIIKKFNTHVNRGSIHFATPHLNFIPEESFKDDIFAFGMVLYFILTKKLPYSDNLSGKEILFRIFNGSKPKIPDDVPPDFSLLMIKCWNSIPQQRPTIDYICNMITKMKLPNSNEAEILEYQKYLQLPDQSSSSYANWNKGFNQEMSAASSSDLTKLNKNENTSKMEVKTAQDSYSNTTPSPNEKINLLKIDSIPQNQNIETTINSSFTNSLDLSSSSYSQLSSSSTSSDEQAHLNVDIYQNDDISGKTTNKNNIPPVSTNSNKYKTDTKLKSDSLLQTASSNNNNNSVESNGPTEINNNIEKTSKIAKTNYPQQKSNMNSNKSLINNSPKSSTNKQKVLTINFVSNSSDNEDNYSYDYSDDPFTMKSIKIKKVLSIPKVIEAQNLPDRNKAPKIPQSQNSSLGNKKSNKFPINRNTESQNPTPKKANNKKSSSQKVKANHTKENSIYDMSDENEPTKIMEIRKRAAKGDKVAQNELGMHYLDKEKSNSQNDQKDYQKAFQLFTLSDGQGDFNAAVNLGICNEKGYGTPINFGKAFRLYLKAHEGGNIDGTLALAHCYEEGVGTVIDVVKAAELYQKCTDEGETDGIVSLAKCKMFGIGTSEDHESAFNSLCVFDVKESSDAIALRGLCYELGIGIQKNINEAIKLYNEAIDVGNSRGFMQLGLLELTGTGIPFNPIEGIRKLSKLQDAEPLILLGNCYQKGIGVKVDEKKAFQCYQNAAKMNYWCGIAMVGDSLIKGRGVETNIAQGIKDIRRASEVHNSLGLVLYGRLHIHGYFFDQNFSEACSLFQIASKNGSDIGESQYGKTLVKLGQYSEGLSLVKKAADRKYRGGLYNYGIYLLNGIRNPNGNNSDGSSNQSEWILEPNPDEAVKYLKLAADLGNKNARVQYGLCLKHGKGVLKDLEAAKKYFELASLTHSLDGKYYYSKMIIKDPKKKNEAISLLTYACESNHMKSHYFYGKCLFYGDNINKDIKKGIIHLNTASRNGCLKAKKILDEYNS